LTQFLKKLKAWLAKLAFWRKHAADPASEPGSEPAPSAAVDTAEPTSAQSVAKPGWLARLKSLLTFRRRKIETVADAADELEIDADPAAKRKNRTQVSDEPEVPEPKPRFVARLKQWLTFRRKPTETEAEPDAEADAERKPKTQVSEEPAVPEPKPGFLARLKGWLRFRRKAVEAEAEADDKTQVIEKSKGRSETTPEGEEEAPPPSRLKRLLIRLRSKWVWIPALSLAVVGLVSWVVVIMMHATHEKERLQVELKAAKKMLEQKQIMAVKPPAPLPPPAAPAKPEKKIDPAFDIVGHTPAPQSEEESGINASDCVVKDKESVAENLKNCITSFNQAVASASTQSKKP